MNLLSFNHQKNEYVAYTTYFRKCKKIGSKNKKTIKSIDNAFIQLLKRKSFDKITINEVSKTADINRVTFYNYFIDKYDWFQKYLYKQLEAFILLKKNLILIVQTKKFIDYSTMLMPNLMNILITFIFY